MSCGGPLGELREERKIVSVVFCDLAGSTEAAHAADPEDVRRAMQAYYSDVTEVIARFGGVVEKFIGDAVVGVWGVPQTREDDAERAVLAALCILEAVAIDVRIAVNTGRVVAVVDPGVDPGVGVVGDVMNTAARLQAAAPIRAVVVGETTMRATERAIDYEALQPVLVKGKPEPVPVFRALTARHRPRRGSSVDTPFLGRRSELELLVSVFQRAVDAPGLQLVTVVGEPGIGKSRLIAEFERTVAERARTLRGHCLPYGDGMGFWPLGEAVKQYLGIDERDSAERARSELDNAVSAMEDGAWLRVRLAPLVGLKGEGGAREEVFTAWQRFLDEVASQMPLVLILEDLHWAHPAMLAFVQYLAEWSVDVPLVVAGTARPELLESNPAWAAGLANVTTIALRPLDDAATRELARALVSRGEARDDTAQALVDRCGGNPLYAEEFARLLSDQRHDPPNADLDVPQGIHAVIAARVDTLAPERKELLHHAAVVGKVFWAGAVADLAARDPAVVRSELHELARKELIRRSRRSAVPGDDEYVFWHDLVHQVAYEQIPRSRRGETHRRVAEWIERSSDERLGDRAELIAYHYAAALSIAERDGLDVPDDVRLGAVRFTTLAAERAVGMDVDHAVDLLDRALRLEDGPTLERGKILCLVGTCDVLAGRFAHAIPALHEARAIADAVGDLETLGTAYFQEAEALFFSGVAGGWITVAEEGIRRLEGETPTGGLAALLGQAAFGASTRNDNHTAMRLVDRAIQVAGQVGDQFSLALAVDIRGLIRARTGDNAAFDDFEQATRLFEDLGSPYATMSMTHLGGAIHLWHGPARAADALAQAIAHGSRIRNATYEADARIFDINRLFDQGRWDDLIAAADHLTGWAAGNGSDSEAAAMAELVKAHVLAVRGEPSLGAERSMEFAHGNERDDGGYAITVSALVAWAAGDDGRALTFVQSLAPAHITSTSSFTEITRLAVTLGVPAHARALLATVGSGPPTFHHNATTANAILAECAGDTDRAAQLYSDAAAAWRAFGGPYELAHSLAGQARCASDADRDALQAESDEIFDNLGVSYKARALGRAAAS